MSTSAANNQPIADTLGVPPHIVGHSDIEVTMTTHAHAAPEEKRATLRKLGDVLG